MKRILPVVAVSAVVVTGLVCGTIAASAEVEKTEVVTNVFDSTSFEKVNHAMDCNQDGVVNVYDMNMLLDFLHCKENAVEPNVQINQRIVDAAGKSADTYLLENIPDILPFVAEKDIYADTYSMADLEQTFEGSSDETFPAVVTLKLSRPLTLNEISDIIYFANGNTGEDSGQILFENICKELEEKKGGKLETSDFSSETEYDEIRILVGCHLESGKTELSGTDVRSVVPVKNGDMTGKVITNTDGRITAVRQYLGQEIPELLSLISDYTVSGDAEQVGDDTGSQYSKAIVKLSQPVSLDMLSDMSDNSGIYNSVCKFLDGTKSENTEITEFAFTVSTYEGKNHVIPETVVPTFSAK